MAKSFAKKPMTTEDEVLARHRWATAFREDALRCAARAAQRGEEKFGYRLRAIVRHPSPESPLWVPDVKDGEGGEPESGFSPARRTRSTFLDSAVKRAVQNSPDRWVGDNGKTATELFAAAEAKAKEEEELPWTVYDAEGKVLQTVYATTASRAVAGLAYYGAVRAERLVRKPTLYKC